MLIPSLGPQHPLPRDWAPTAGLPGPGTCRIMKPLRSQRLNPAVQRGGSGLETSPKFSVALIEPRMMASVQCVGFMVWVPIVALFTNGFTCIQLSPLLHRNSFMGENLYFISLTANS